jgi:hypothetical protein
MASINGTNRPQNIVTTSELRKYIAKYFLDNDGKLTDPCNCLRLIIFQPSLPITRENRANSLGVEENKE